jgi:ABC-type sulfate transport system permease component
MSLGSESIRTRRYSLAWAMAVIAFIAADLAALRASFPRLPNFGLVIMILVLEGGLFRLASARGAPRAFWLGFEVAGWAYVVTCVVFTWTAWRLSRSLFEGYVIGKPIRLPFEMYQFLIFAGVLQLLISLAIALSIGSLARSIWRRRGE